MSAYKQILKFFIGGLIGVHVNSIVFEDIRTFSSQFILFLWKKFERKKAGHKQKSLNKTKISKQKTTNTTIFCTKKTSEWGEIVYFAFWCSQRTSLLISYYPSSSGLQKKWYGDDRSKTFIKYTCKFIMCYENKKADFKFKQFASNFGAHSYLCMYVCVCVCVCVCVSVHVRLCVCLCVFTG